MSTGALIIIPTYNEAENVEPLLTQIFSLKEDLHIVIVDDNSPDKTAAITRNLQKKYAQRLHLLQFSEKGGIGRAYLRGFRFALEHNYQYILQMDADFSHDPADVPRLLEQCIKQSHDVAIGSRYIQGVNVINWPISRVLTSYFASRYVRIVTGLPIHDPTAGFTCFRRHVLALMDFSKLEDTVGYIFQVALKHRAWKHGYSIQEVPIIFTNRIKGESKAPLATIDLIKALWNVVTLSFQGIMEKHLPHRGKTSKNQTNHTT